MITSEDCQITMDGDIIIQSGRIGDVEIVNGKLTIDAIEYIHSITQNNNDFVVGNSINQLTIDTVHDLNILIEPNGAGDFWLIFNECENNSHISISSSIKLTVDTKSRSHSNSEMIIYGNEQLTFNNNISMIYKTMNKIDPIIVISTTPFIILSEGLWITTRDPIKTGQLKAEENTYFLKTTSDTHCNYYLSKEDKLTCYRCTSDYLLKNGSCELVSIPNCLNINNESLKCEMCEDGYCLNDDYSECITCNYIFGDKCMTCNSTECFTCSLGYKLNDNHTGCEEYTECTLYDEKCVKCNSNKEYTNINSCSQCNEEHTEACY